VSLFRRTRVDVDGMGMVLDGCVEMHLELLEGLALAQSQFVLESDRSQIPALVALVQDQMERLGLCDQNERTRVGLALEEALLNAMIHGNLEVSSDLCQRSEALFRRVAEERRQQQPYRDRRVHVTCRLSPAEAFFTIRDEGPGFDVAALPDPADPASIERMVGRGLLLIQAFMDEVGFNDEGNQITLVKRPGKGHATCSSN
jgi:anti-sigma regulatory factor (Ser/Thr protein kinase)